MTQYPSDSSLYSTSGIDHNTYIATEMLKAVVTRSTIPFLGQEDIDRQVDLALLYTKTLINKLNTQ